MGFSLLLLPAMFISCYTIIDFFVKNFFPNVYISVNTMFERSCLPFCWEIGHPLSMYVTREMEGVIQNIYRCAQRERGITLHVYVRTYTHLYSCFCLMVSCFICKNLILPLFKTGVFFRNCCFSPMRSISVVMK